MKCSTYIKLKKEGGRAFRLTIGGWVPLDPGELIACSPDGTVQVLPSTGGALLARRKSVTGDYTIALEEGGRIYKLGPRYGYLVKTPEEEPDPVKRVARRIGIPASLVTRELPEGATVSIKEGEDVATDGVIVGGSRVTGFTYVIRSFTKPMRGGGRGRFVSGIARTVAAQPTTIEAACKRLQLSHRPEWRVDAPRGAAGA